MLQRGLPLACPPPSDLPACANADGCPLGSLCFDTNYRLVPCGRGELACRLGDQGAGGRCVDRHGERVIACLGDSNTAAGWPAPDTVRWCEMTAALLPTVSVMAGGRVIHAPTVFVNEAVGGATVSDPGISFPWGLPQLEVARTAGADVVIAAFGTNDLGWLHLTPAQLVAAYQSLAQRAAPLDFLVALTPPVFPPQPDLNPTIQEANAALRTAFMASHILDFWTGFGEGDFELDGLHLNAQGQIKRAQVAASALSARRSGPQGLP